jgi:hypothetical protein
MKLIRELRLCRFSISNKARRLPRTCVTNSWPPVGRERGARGPIGEWEKAGRRKGIGTVGSDIARIGCVAAGAVTLYHSRPRARPSARLPQARLRKCAGGFSTRRSARHRRRRHGNGRILMFRRQNEPKGLQLRFLPRGQQLAADGTLHSSRTSLHRYRLGDFVGCPAGWTRNVGYFHASNLIRFCRQAY